MAVDFSWVSLRAQGHPLTSSRERPNEQRAQDGNSTQHGNAGAALGKNKCLGGGVGDFFLGGVGFTPWQGDPAC